MILTLFILVVLNILFTLFVNYKIHYLARSSQKAFDRVAESIRKLYQKQP